MPGARGARPHARRHAVLLRQIDVVDAVDAQRALLHHALIGIQLARAIGAGPGAQPAADAQLLVDQDDAVLGALVRRPGRADRDAGGILAMQAGLGEMHGAAVRALADLVAVDAVQPGAARSRAIRVLVGQRRRMAAGVPFLAGDHAGLAADAGVEIDHQAEPPGRASRGQAGHRGARNSCPYLETSGRRGQARRRAQRGRIAARSAPPRPGARSMRTRRSYQAAWPVTGSALA